MTISEYSTVSILVAVTSVGIAGCLFGRTSLTCDDLAKTCGCEDRPPCPPDDSGAAGGSGGSSGTGGGGGTSADGSSCDRSKEPNENPCVVDDRFGVFVSPNGSDSASGTKALPFKTIARALTRANGKNVYVCAGTYAEQVTIDASLDGARMFGGFDCASWSYSAGMRPKVVPASGVALAVKALSTGATIEDMEFDAPDATTAGASSIGAIVDASMNVSLRRVKIAAGKGAPGQAGADGGKGADGTSADPQQQGASAKCTGAPATQNGGSWAGPSLCRSKGGAGGFALIGSDGTAGIAGDPRTNVTPPNVDNGGPKGSTGGDGNPGMPGNAGAIGSASTSAGAFSPSGYSPASAGGDGTDGFPGQGGGGGGASNATGMCIGASGGAGGMGGCGGTHGIGGGSGGASVALLSWQSSITLDACELASSSGGTGGKGGNGGAGGLGKDGAEGGAAYAGDAGPNVGHGGKGGPGGNGGPGGPGAGGNGGPSYALVYHGTAPMKSPDTIPMPGAGGAKGVGGVNSKGSAADGTPGLAAAEFAIP